MLDNVKTPPMSPEREGSDLDEAAGPNAEPGAVPVPGENAPGPSTPTATTSGTDGRQTSGRKRVLKNRSKTARQLIKTKEELVITKRLKEKYRKEAYRLRKQSQRNIEDPDTPRKKVDRMLKRPKHKIRRKLVLQQALIDQLKSSFAKHRAKRTKIHFLQSRVIRKYRMAQWLEKEMCISVRRLKAGKKKLGQPPIHDGVAKDVFQFYEREDVSRMTARKKETITNHKVKRQRRFLLDTLSKLHIKFLALYPGLTISYPSVCRLRPFHVRIPSIENRETCLCKTCDNVQLILYTGLPLVLAFEILRFL